METGTAPGTGSHQHQGNGDGDRGDGTGDGERRREQLRAPGWAARGRPCAHLIPGAAGTGRDGERSCLSPYESMAPVGMGCVWG